MVDTGGVNSIARSDPSGEVRHPHLAEARPPGWVRVDMHAHTMWSGDSTTTPEEIIDALRDLAIDVVCITDHNAIAGAETMRERLAQAEVECRVVVGEEVRCGRGELIGLFLSERVAPNQTALATAEAIRAQGGLVYAPHPFDPMRNGLSLEELDDLVARDMLDIVEGHNGKTSLRSLNQRAVEYASENGLAVGAGSDAHVPRAFGAGVVTMPDFEGAESFLASLKVGRLAGHHFDEPRPWAPRIIPST